MMKSFPSGSNPGLKMKLARSSRVPKEGLIRRQIRRPITPHINTKNHEALPGKARYALDWPYFRRQAQTAWITPEICENSTDYLPTKKPACGFWNRFAGETVSAARPAVIHGSGHSAQGCAAARAAALKTP